MHTDTRRPRVLLLANHLGESGISIHIMKLAQGMVAQGWEVALVTAVYEAEKIMGTTWFEDKGIQHFHVPLPNLLRFSFTMGHVNGMIKALSKLKDIVHQFRPDVLHVHGLGMTPYASYVRRRYNVPLVSTCHGMPNRRVQALARRLSIASGLLNRMFGDRVIAISSELETVMGTLWKVDPDRIRRVFHGVDPTLFRTPTETERAVARKAFDLRDTDSVVCIIGRLHPLKRHDVLLRALARLAEDGLHVVALCAGNGPIAHEIEALAIELGLASRVHMLGFADARQVLWASDVLILPSKREGFPLVVIEAMSCGVVPVRTPTAGAYDTIKDGKSGFIVPFDDPAVLAERVKQLFEDDPLRRQMAKAALQTAGEKFTATHMITNTLDVYREAIQMRGRTL